MRVKFSLFHVFFIKVGVIIHTHTHKHFLCFHWRSDTNPNKENPSRNALIIFLIMPTVPRGLDSRPGIICLHIPCRIVRRSAIHSSTPPKGRKETICIDIYTKHNPMKNGLYSFHPDGDACAAMRGPPFTRQWLQGNVRIRRVRGGGIHQKEKHDRKRKLDVWKKCLGLATRRSSSTFSHSIHYDRCVNRHSSR